MLFEKKIYLPEKFYPVAMIATLSVVKSPFFV